MNGHRAIPHIPASSLPSITSQEYDKIMEFHKTYGGHPDVAQCCEDLSARAGELARSTAKESKVLVLESLLLEAVTSSDEKRAKSAINMQKAFISSNVMGITEDDILIHIMEKANALIG